MSRHALPSSGQSVAAVTRQWVLHTFSGRALVIGAALKLLAFVSRYAFASGLVDLLDTLGGILLVVGAVALAYRLFVDVRRVLLWRVRRKLMVSYIFVGVVPALLIIVFFVVAGLLLFFNVGSFLMRSRIQTLIEQVHNVADSTMLELQRAGAGEFSDILQHRQEAAADSNPNISYAIVPAERNCQAAPTTGSAGSVESTTAGPWAHLDPPVTIPQWIPCGGRAGLLAYRAGEDGGTRLVIRAVAFPDGASPRYALVVDLPVGNALAQRLRADTGIQLGDLTTFEEARGGALPVIGRSIPGDPVAPPRETRGIIAGPANIVVGDKPGSSELQWVTLIDYVDWESGRPGTLAASFRMSPLDAYRRISPTSRVRVANNEFGQIMLLLLGIVAGLFLIIQGVALLMGFALARSITGSVHELFTGTERVRRGDFTHKIAIRSRDQLGELAESFNSMTASIEDLLQQKAEKERLEQELRIARAIQMSLLPQGGIALPHVALTAHCEPAREVGGDYYDYVRIDDRRLGLLIADVAGKGTSAALYMAVLKGIILSLSQLHTSPRRLLMDANRILARHLDSRSFITVTYAVVDIESRTLTHARAGHCPLIHVPGPYADNRRAQLCAPDGLVLGLQIDIGDRFDQLLEEATLPLGTGDLVLLYTDGITETMNGAGEFFGETRLGALLEEHADLPCDQLRERILREVRDFAGTTPQQDDMTMLLLKMEN